MFSPYGPYVPFQHPDDLLPSSQALHGPSVSDTRTVQLRDKLPRAALRRAGLYCFIAGIAIVTLLSIARQTVHVIQS